MIDRVRADLSRIPLAIRVSIIIAVIVNAVLLAAWVWSRPGMTTHVRFEASGTQFTVWVDGRQQGQANFAAPRTGQVELTLEDADEVPSLPQPRGLERVRVTDLSTGVVLFDGRFDRLPVEGAQVVTSGFGLTSPASKVDAKHGVLAAHHGNAIVRVGDDGWRDYRVDVTYRNMTTGIVRVRADGSGSGVEFGFRPFRHLDNRLTLFDKGQTVTNQLNAPIEASGIEVVRSMTRMLLRPYPYLAAIGVAALGLVVAATLLPASPRAWARPSLMERAGGRLWWLPALAVAVFAFGVTLFLNYDYGAHMPHVPDEISYLFQSKIFAAGHLTAPPPKVVESFQLGNPPLIVINDGKWASLYPFAHPLVLAVGQVLGAVWLIPPLLGAGCVLFVFAIGWRVGNARTGLLAAALLAMSPLFLMTASNFMSHNTAAFFLLASIFLLTLTAEGADEAGVASNGRMAWSSARKRTVWYPLLAGLAFGLLLNTRQLSGAAAAVPFGLLLLTFPLPRGRRLTGVVQIAAFAAGAAALLCCYFGYKWATAGDPFASEQIQAGENAIGFGGLHSVRAGIENEQTQLAFLLLVLNNWPLTLGLGLALLPFALGTRSRWDWFFLLLVVFLWGAYTLYFTNGLMHGPRYWYETTPLLMLLMARGADAAAVLLASVASGVRERLGASPLGRTWAGVVVVYGLVLAVAIPASNDWLRGSGGDFKTDTVPHNAKELRGFNGIDDRLITLIDDARPKNALVIMDNCPGWQCYGNVYWRNSPWLDGDVIYARDIPEKNAAVFAAYPDRVVYRGHYFPPPSFTPYGPSATSPAPEPPLAAAIPTPTVAPTPTPDALAAARRDEQRRFDLQTVADALARYYSDHGSYPVAENIQSLCAYPNDAGCALREYLDTVPRDPGPDGIYWYRSDGRSYTLFAALEGPAPPSACPTPIPEHLSRVEHPYCVAAGAPP